MLDGHEIDQLVATLYAERFHCEDARGQRQSIDLQDAGYERAAGKVPRKKAWFTLTALTAWMASPGTSVSTRSTRSIG